MLKKLIKFTVQFSRASETAIIYEQTEYMSQLQQSADLSPVDNIRLPRTRLLQNVIIGTVCSLYINAF